MSRYLRIVLDAESAQRGFLLTEDTRYLRGFDPAIRSLDPLLDRIVAELRASGFERRRRQGPGPALHHRQEGGRDADLAAALWRGRSRNRPSSCSIPTSASARCWTSGISCASSTTRESCAPDRCAREFREGSPDLARAARGRGVPQPAARRTGRRPARSRHAPARAGDGSPRHAQPRARPQPPAAHVNALPPLEQPAEGGRAREGCARPRIAR